MRNHGRESECEAVLIPVPSVKVDAMDGKFVYTGMTDGDDPMV